MNECEHLRKLGQKQDTGVKASSGLNPMNGQPIITVDVDEFEPLLKNPDLTEEQKRELLQALWNIVVAFIDFGFGVHPIQHVFNDSGKLDKTEFEQGFGRDCVIQSEDTKLASKYKYATKQDGGPT